MFSFFQVILVVAWCLYFVNALSDFIFNLHYIILNIRDKPCSYVWTLNDCFRYRGTTQTCVMAFSCVHLATFIERFETLFFKKRIIYSLLHVAIIVRYKSCVLAKFFKFIYFSC